MPAIRRRLRQIWRISAYVIRRIFEQLVIRKTQYIDTIPKLAQACLLEVVPGSEFGLPVSSTIQTLIVNLHVSA